jgi:hypothetical protein
LDNVSNPTGERFPGFAHLIPNAVGFVSPVTLSLKESSMKRVLSLLVLVFSFALFTGCGGGSKTPTKVTAGGGGGGTTAPTEKK